MKPTRQPAIENDFVSVYSSTQQSVGAGNLQDRGRLVAVEGEIRVREVVDDQQLPLACELDDLLEEAGVDVDGRRVVRIGEDEHARTLALDRLADRADRVVGRHVEVGDRRAREDRRVAVDRVGRRRHDHRVARLDEHPHQMREPLLGADRRDRLRLGVELDVELARVEVADRRAQPRNPARGRVAVVARLPRCLLQLRRPRCPAMARPDCRSRGRSRPRRPAAARA